MRRVIYGAIGAGLAVCWLLLLVVVGVVAWVWTWAEKRRA